MLPIIASVTVFFTLFLFIVLSPSFPIYLKKRFGFQNMLMLNKKPLIPIELKG